MAFALTPGEVSEPLAVPGGYRILRVAERSEGCVTPFEGVQADILKRLTQTRRAEEYDRFLEGLRKNATIDIRVREVPLKVELPTTGSILEAPTEGLGAPAPRSAPAAARPAAEESEFTTTPQARPERVAPQAAPIPTPTPTPTPPPPSVP